MRGLSARRGRTGAGLLGWAATVALLAVAASRVELDTSAERFLDRRSETYAFYEASTEAFGGDEMLVVGFPRDPARPGDGLAVASQAAEILASLPEVRRVDSVHTLPSIRAEVDGTLVLDPLAEAVEAPEALFEAAARDRLYRRNLVAEDGSVLAVTALLEADATDFEAVVEAARRVAAEDGRVSGVPVFRVEANARTLSDLVRFVPLCVAILFALAWIRLGSAWGAALVLVPGSVGSLCVAAASAAFGISLDLLSVTLPAICLALGAAYAMHLLARARECPLAEAAPAVRRPTLASGLTTGLAFASVGLIEIEAVRQLGLLGAVGVLGATAAAVSLLPLLLRIRPPGGATPRQDRWVAGLGRALSDRVSAPAVIGIWLVLAAGLSAGLVRLEVETDVTAWFDEGTRPRDEYEWIKRALSGISPVNVVIEAPPGRSVTEPPVIAAIDALGRHLGSLASVGKAVSVADPLRQIHGGFLDDPGQPLPQGRELVEQYLLLLSGVEALGDVITPDHTRANVLLRVDDNGSGALQAVVREAEVWWRDHGPEGFLARGTGIMFEFARAEDAITRGMIRGTGAATLAILAVCLLTFRQPRLGLVTMIPNLLPLAGLLGAMGLAGMPLDAGSVVVGCLALGIGVDDSFHVVHAFVGSRGGPRARAGEAVRRTLDPLVSSTAFVSTGFLVLAISDLSLTRHLGILTAGAMGVCVLADLTLLPALLARLGAAPADPARPQEEGLRDRPPTGSAHGTDAERRAAREPEPCA